MSTLTDFLAQVNRMMGPRSVALDAADHERHLRDAERLRSLRAAHRPCGRSKRAPRVNAARRSGTSTTGAATGGAGNGGTTGDGDGPPRSGPRLREPLDTIQRLADDVWPGRYVLACQRRKRWIVDVVNLDDLPARLRYYGVTLDAEAPPGAIVALLVYRGGSRVEVAHVLGSRVALVGAK